MPASAARSRCRVRVSAPALVAGTRREAPPSSAHASERAMHRRDGRGADPEGVVGILDLDAYRKARGQPDPVERALDARQSVHAGAVLGRDGPPQTDDGASEPAPRL